MNKTILAFLIIAATAANAYSQTSPPRGKSPEKSKGSMLEGDVWGHKSSPAAQKEAAQRGATMKTPPVNPGARPGAEAPRGTGASSPAPGRLSSSADRGASAKKPSPNPKRGTNATGDEDEVDDLEIQRRTVEGASKPRGLAKGPNTPPKSNDRGMTAPRKPQ